MRWVGAILIGLGLVLGAVAIEHLQGARPDTVDCVRAPLEEGAELSLAFHLGMDGARTVDLVVYPAEGFASQPPVPAPTVTWSRSHGPREVDSGTGALGGSRTPAPPLSFPMTAWSTQGDERGTIHVHVDHVPDVLAGAQATIRLHGPSTAGVIVALAAVGLMPLVLGFACALLVGGLVVLLSQRMATSLEARPAGAFRRDGSRGSTWDRGRSSESDAAQ